MRNKATGTKKVNKKVLIATIDIGKDNHVGYWRSHDGIDCKPFVFANTRIGFDCFWHTIRTAQTVQKAEDILIGFESTGPYGKPLIHYLRKKPATLVQVNPVHTKRLKELDDNSPLKSDAKDPQVLADIIQFGHYLSVVVPTGAAAELRALAHIRESVITLRNAEYNRLYNLISVLFPEFLKILKNLHTRTAQHLMTHYAVPGDIEALGIVKLTRILFTISRKKLGAARAAMLFKAARSSIGVRAGSDSMRAGIRDSIARIALYDQQITAMEKQMRHYLGLVPISRQLLSIKGIGTVTAAGIIGEIGDFGAYRSSKAIIKLAGLNLYEISSGQHRGARRISKRGRTLLRKLLYFAAMRVVRKNGVLHRYYHRLIGRGTPRMKALIAVMRKLICIMYALARDNTVYSVEYSIHKAA